MTCVQRQAEVSSPIDYISGLSPQTECRPFANLSGDSIIVLEDKLLEFNISSIERFNAYISGTKVQPKIEARLHGTFFHSPPPIANDDVRSADCHIVCFRDTPFSISGSINLPEYSHSPTTAVAEYDGGFRHMSVHRFETALSAVESHGGAQVALAASPHIYSHSIDFPCRKVSTAVLPEANCQESNSRTLWNDVQFQAITCASPDHYFIVHLTTYACLEDGTRLSLCDTTSSPIAVRLGSPPTAPDILGRNKPTSLSADPKTAIRLSSIPSSFSKATFSFPGGDFLDSGDSGRSFPIHKSSRTTPSLWDVPEFGVDSPLLSANDRIITKLLGPRLSKITSQIAAQRIGEEATLDNIARDHPLYHNVVTGPDRLYHCPWEGQASCQHRPEKLKCNYDKFVDSHLKPYRCKIAACKNLHFSSTACLLRHEREAHLMHGHGDKPFLCTHIGCERSVAGNGFPRHWNLRDHMKRVHWDHEAPTCPVPPSEMKSIKRKREE